MRLVHSRLCLSCQLYTRGVFSGPRVVFLPCVVFLHCVSDKSIAGAVVVGGEFTKANGFRLLRQGKVVWEGGSLDSLKRFKDDVNKVAKGVEFGVGIPYGKVKVGDKLVSFNRNKVHQKMEIKL